MQPEELVFGVGEFVSYLNQTLEFAYPSVAIVGEVANFRVSKNRWVYFDLKDNDASIKCFGTVYQLSAPIEDGMMLKVRGQPRLHPLYGFSVNVSHLVPVGEGSIMRAASLLQAKLQAEGLFDAERKRRLPYPPSSIGLITSAESAAYADFVKVLSARWRGLDIRLSDVQVQGEAATGMIVAAIERFNAQPRPPEVIVITRGGGSAEDLGAFNTEAVVRSIAASRIPTLLAIGHEIDVSLAELAADLRASTPSNAAELLVPDRLAVKRKLLENQEFLRLGALKVLQRARQDNSAAAHKLRAETVRLIGRARQNLALRQQLLAAYNPQAMLSRGYALVRINGAVVKSGLQLELGTRISLQLADARVWAKVSGVKLNKGGNNAKETSGRL